MIRPALALLLAAAAKPAQPGRASIPFANTPAGITDWQVANDHTLYLQGNNRWYRADLFGTCFDLPYVQALGFETGVAGSFDEASAVIAGGQRCPVKTLVRVDAPPKPVHRKR